MLRRKLPTKILMPGSTKGQEKRMRNSNQKLRKGVPAKYEENVFQHDDIEALDQVSQRDCEVSEVFKTQLDKALGSLV